MSWNEYKDYKGPSTLKKSSFKKCPRAPKPDPNQPTEKRSKTKELFQLVDEPTNSEEPSTSGNQGIIFVSFEKTESKEKSEANSKKIMSVDVKSLSRQEKCKAKAKDGSSNKNKQPSKRLRVVNNPPSALFSSVPSEAGGEKYPTVEKEIPPEGIQPAGPVVAQPTMSLDVPINVKGHSMSTN